MGIVHVGQPVRRIGEVREDCGRTASITVTNVRAFAIVGPKSSTRGSIRVFVDGTLVATVSETASSTVYRRVLYWKALRGREATRSGSSPRALPESTSTRS